MKIDMHKLNKHSCVLLTKNRDFKLNISTYGFTVIIGSFLRLAKGECLWLDKSNDTYDMKKNKLVDSDFLIIRRTKKIYRTKKRMEIIFQEAKRLVDEDTSIYKFKNIGS